MQRASCWRMEVISPNMCSVVKIKQVLTVVNPGSVPLTSGRLLPQLILVTTNGTSSLGFVGPCQASAFYSHKNAALLYITWNNIENSCENMGFIDINTQLKRSYMLPGFLKATPAGIFRTNEIQFSPFKIYFFIIIKKSTIAYKRFRNVHLLLQLEEYSKYLVSENQLLRKL